MTGARMDGGLPARVASLSATAGDRAVPWVLLRGLGRDARHWGDFPRQLAAAFPGAGVLTPDLPGNGSRCHETSPTRVAALTEDLRAALGPQAGPVRVLAMSLGAMVAADWAGRYPHELAAAVLVNTSLAPFSPFWDRLQPRQYLRVLSLAGRGAAGWEWQVLQMTSRRHAGDAALAARWADWRRAQPVSAGNALRQLIAAARFRAQSAAPAVPMLLLGSRGDQLVHPRCSQALADRWALPLHDHPDAGHDLPLDDPDWVLDRLRNWPPALGRVATPPVEGYA